MMEHGLRVGFQRKTRMELGGPFWGDYRRSVRIPTSWEDSDAWWVNYIGHPIHGAAAGYLWIDHESGAPLDIGLSRHYWATRGRAALRLMFNPGRTLSNTASHRLPWYREGRPLSWR